MADSVHSVDRNHAAVNHRVNRPLKQKRMSLSTTAWRFFSGQKSSPFVHSMNGGAAIHEERAANAAAFKWTHSKRSKSMGTIQAAQRRPSITVEQDQVGARPTTMANSVTFDRVMFQFVSGMKRKNGNASALRLVVPFMFSLDC